MILGLRCSSKDYAFAILDGTKAAPRLVQQDLVNFPANYSRSEAVCWFEQELNGILSKHRCKGIVIKGFEGLTRGAPFVQRIEHEAAAYIAGAKHGIKSVTRKVKSTIAKALGKKGRAKYLQTVDSSSIPEFDDLPEKVQEAILAARSELP